MPQDRSLSLSLYLYQSVSPTLCKPPPPSMSLNPSLSLLPSHLFCLPSIYLSLSLLLPFISPFFPQSISLPPPYLSLAGLKCLIVGSILSSYTAAFVPSVKTREHLISFVKINLSVLSFPCFPRQNRLTLSPTEECLFVMLNQDEVKGKEFFFVGCRSR